MNADQARNIIRAVTGLVVGEHPQALSVAFGLGQSLVEACETLDAQLRDERGH